MPKFSTHVALMSPEYQAMSFGPGDEVPEWAVGQVGAHVLEPEDPADTDESDGEDESDEKSEDQDSGHSEESDGEDSDDGEGDSESSDDNAPDFTKPAPARRGRARKQ